MQKLEIQVQIKVFARPLLTFVDPATFLLSRKDVGVTSIGDGQDAGAEELTTSGTKVDIVCCKHAVLVVPFETST